MTNRVFRAVALLAATVIGACATAAPEAPADRFVIGTAGPMSGAYAVFGNQMRSGAQLAVDDINAAGGVLGRRLVLEIGDDRCDPRQAVSVANRMANRGVIFMAGHFCSGSSIPASQVYAEEGILQISPASTNPALTDEGGDNVFRVCGRDDRQGLVAARYLADNHADANIAIVHDRTAYGKGIADIARSALNAAGVTEVIYDAYTAGKSDYSDLVSKLKAEDIDVLYVGGYHTEAALIARQMREQGMDTQLIAADALVTDEYWSIAGDAGEGTLMTFHPDPRAFPEARQVVARSRAQGYEPEGYTLHTYAAIQVWAQAAEMAGSTDLDAVVDALKANTFDTVLGRIGFDDKGDVVGIDTFVWYIWSNGTYYRA